MAETSVHGGRHAAKPSVPSTASAAELAGNRLSQMQLQLQGDCRPSHAPPRFPRKMVD